MYPQERSSAKRKGMYRAVQEQLNAAQIHQLVLDMKVRWSSTYLMLLRALEDQRVSLSESSSHGRIHSVSDT